jgi:multidrug transporter EmrE-like cation transporter
MTGFIYVLGCVLFTVYGQLVVKWRVGKAGALPTAFSQKILFLAGLILSPWVASGIAAGFFALLCWLAAMTKFELSYAYPFMSLAFVLVMIFSVFLFHETVTAPKVLGLLLIMIGIIVTTRG